MSSEPWEPPAGSRRVSRGGLLVGLLAAVGTGFFAGRVWTNTPGEPTPTVTASPAEVLAPTPADASPPADRTDNVVVPGVSGLTVRQARAVLQTVGLRATLDEFESAATPRSVVVSQAPVEGSAADIRSAVGLRTDTVGTEYHSRCGTVRIANRGFGTVVVGTSVGVRTADAGQFLFLDTLPPASDLRVSARRLTGPGSLRFVEFGRTSTTTYLPVERHRTAQGWPPHWGVVGEISGPGCWALHVRGNGVQERLLFDVSRRDWRRHWR